MQSDRIYFYEPLGEHGYLSNFSSFGFVLDGLFWPTAEHYYQAQKFINDADIFLSIRNAATPAEAKEIARKQRDNRRPDWKDVKLSVMTRAIEAKFFQNAQLRKKLLSTRKANLVEEAGNDIFWGSGFDGTGLNNLGKVLMRVRAKLASIELTPSIEE